MPLPAPNSGESEADFIERCMGNPTMLKEYPDQKQRAAVCYNQFRGKKDQLATDELMSLAQKAQLAIDDMIVKGWLPAGTSQNDLSDGDFAWLSDAYRRGDAPKSSGRKLPYKIHGKVNVRGWKAAMAAAQGARGGTSFSGGPSKEAVIRRLCRSKPKEVQSEVCENLNKDKTAFDMVQESGEKLLDQIQDDIDRQRCHAQIDEFRRLVAEATIVDLTLMQKIRKKLEEMIHS